jgi:hypothetical protein
LKIAAESVDDRYELAAESEEKREPVSDIDTGVGG